MSPFAATKTTRDQDIEDSQKCLQQSFSRSTIKPDIDMATKTLEARFEHLSVHDENEPATSGSTMLKSKVGTMTLQYLSIMLTATSKVLHPQQRP